MKLHKLEFVMKCSGSFRTALAGLGTLCLLLASTGCKSTEKAKQDDPLFGVKPPQVNAVPPTGSPIPGAQSLSTPPPLPGRTSATSTASLASLPGGRPLSINEPRPPASGAWNPNASTGPHVQPIPRDVPPNSALLTTGSWTQGPATLTSLPSTSPQGAVDPQFALLQARGASNQKVDLVPEGVRLTVLVPNRANAGEARIYEATARDYPAAVQAVLQQIDQQR